MAMAASTQGRRVRFWRVTELITTLREADDGRQLLRLRERLTGAALDRITRRCQIIETEEGYRLEDAKRRRRSSA